MSPSPQAGISPFQTMQARCVVCEKEARFSKLKSTLYSETKRDIDMRPITILWSKKVSPRVDPKLFYFWQCPYCYFTADHVFFQAPFKDSSMSTTRFRKQIQKGFKDNAAYQAVLKLLIFDPGKEKSVFISGLKLNLLACYQWELADDVVNGESIQLGSYYLRLSWMLHDLRNAMQKSPQIVLDAQNLLTSLRKIWPKFSPLEAASLEKSLNFYQQALSQSSAVHTILQEVNVRLIVARIFMKLTAMAEAKKAIITCKSRVKYYESIIRKKSSEDSHFSVQALADMELAHGKALALVNNVELIYDKIDLIILDRQIKAALDVLGRHQDKSYEERLLILKEAKTPDKVISKVLPKEKKKSLMNLLKSG